MSRKETSLLGIDLHEGEIRVVQLKVRSNQSTVEKMGRASMPQGAINHGIISNPELVGNALRSLLDSMAVTATHAVIGLPNDGLSVRTFAVPPAPEGELRMIVEGEVNHHGLIRGVGGAFAFVKLNSDLQPDSNHAWSEDTKIWMDSKHGKVKPNLVTVFAVEQDSINALRDAMTVANLTIEAIEPASYSMYRAILNAEPPQTTFFTVMVSGASTDICVVDQGHLVAFRRIDIGARALAGDNLHSSEFAFAGVNLAAYADEPREAGTRISILNSSALETFSTEVHRTLYYYQREYPNLAMCEKVVLASDDSRLDMLSEELGKTLGFTVDTARPFSSLGDHSSFESSFADRFELVACTAIGLGLHGNILNRAPRIDLFASERNAVADIVSKRNFRGSILTSVMAVVLGIAGCSVYYSQIAKLDADAKNAQAQEQLVKSAIDIKVQERHKQADQYRAFRKLGIPVTAILDSIAGAVAPGTGLTSVNVTNNQAVVIDGEAVNEASMLNTVKALQDCPLLQDLRISWFRQSTNEKPNGPKTGAISFEFKGKTVTLDRIQQGEDKVS